MREEKEDTDFYGTWDGRDLHLVFNHIGIDAFKASPAITGDDIGRELPSAIERTRIYEALSNLRRVRPGKTIEGTLPVIETKATTAACIADAIAETVWEKLNWLLGEGSLLWSESSTVYDDSHWYPNDPFPMARTSQADDSAIRHEHGFSYRDKEGSRHTGDEAFKKAVEDEAIRAAMEEMKERTAEERVSLLTTQPELVTASPDVAGNAFQLCPPTYRDRHGNRHEGNEAVRKAKQEDADYHAAEKAKEDKERRKFEELVELIRRGNEKKNAHEWRGMFAEDWPPLYINTLPPQWLERSINIKKSFTIYGLYTNISRQLDSPEKGALFFMGMCDALGNKIAEFGQFLADITYAINQATMHGDFEPLRELIEAFCSSLWDLITQILTGAFLPEILDGIIDALYRIENAKGPRELGEAVGEYLLFVLETIGPNNIIKAFSKVIKGINMAGKTAKVVDDGKTLAKPAAKKPDSRETKGPKEPETKKSAPEEKKVDPLKPELQAKLNAAGLTRAEVEARWGPSKGMNPVGALDEHFRDHGGKFKAGNMKQYMEKAEEFVRNPPPGTDRVVHPGTGYTWYYNKNQNTFVSVNTKGKPTNMMKPDNGVNYWKGLLRDLRENNP